MMHLLIGSILVFLFDTTLIAQSSYHTPQFEAAFDELINNYRGGEFDDAGNGKLYQAITSAGGNDETIRRAIRAVMRDKSRINLWPQAVVLARANQISSNEIAYWMRHNLELLVNFDSEDFLRTIGNILGSDTGLPEDVDRVLAIANNLPAEQTVKAEQLKRLARAMKGGQEMSATLNREQREYERKLYNEKAQETQSLASPGVSKTKPKAPANIKPAPTPAAVNPEMATISTTSWLPWLLLIVGALAGVGLLMRKQDR